MIRQQFENILSAYVEAGGRQFRQRIIKIVDMKLAQKIECPVIALLLEIEKRFLAFVGIEFALSPAFEKIAIAQITDLESALPARR